MSIQLTLDYNGIIVDFQADGYKVKDGFFPETASDPSSPVTERFDVLIIADNHWELQEKIRAIGLAITWAKKHQSGPQPAYLNFAMIEEDDTWRARITNGMLTWSENLDHNWRRNKALATIILERAPCWEGPETQLPLSNPIETGNLDGLTVYNPSLHRYGNTISFNSTVNAILDSANGLGDFQPGMTITVYGSTSNDGTYTISSASAAALFVGGGITTEAAGDYVGIDAGPCNYVDIAAGDVLGELAAPIRLEITNTFNAASLPATMWISQNVESDPENLEHLLQAEDATGETTAEDGASSGNAYKACAWSGTTETDLLTWDLTTELLNSLKGNYQRLLAHFTAAPGANLWLRLKVKLVTSELWASPLVYLDPYQYIQELCTARLPPYLLDAGDLYPLTLVLSAKHASSGSHTFGLDFLQICPLDGWRKLVPQGYNLDYQARLVDDGIDGFVYADSSAVAGKAAFYVPYGERIHLAPNVPNRLYFLHNNDTNSAPVWRTLSIKAFYRPRRVTL